MPNHVNSCVSLLFTFIRLFMIYYLYYGWTRRAPYRSLNHQRGLRMTLSFFSVCCAIFGINSWRRLWDRLFLHIGIGRRIFSNSRDHLQKSRFLGSWNRLRKNNRYICLYIFLLYAARHTPAWCEFYNHKIVIETLDKISSTLLFFLLFTF